MFPNPLDHAFDVAQHLIVPETHHSIAAREQGRFSERIGIVLLRVMPAVDLDNQPLLFAAEVRDQSADRKLAAEFQTFEPSRA